MSTKKQHYIPRMILKNYTVTDARKPSIYQYDKAKCIERVVRIRDVCRKDNCYEIRDECGIIADDERNFIENAFAALEYRWDKLVSKIMQRGSISDDDRILLYGLMVLQLLRVPAMITRARNSLPLLLNKIGKSISNPYMIDRCIKLAMFPCGVVTPEKNWIFDLVLHYALGKQLVVYYSNVSDVPFMLSGDNPVIYANVDSNWFFPIAQHYCLGLIGNASNKSFYQHTSASFVNFMNKCNYFLNEDTRYLYSSVSIVDICRKWKLNLSI